MPETKSGRARSSLCVVVLRRGFVRRGFVCAVVYLKISKLAD